MGLPWQSQDARLVEEVRRGKPEAFEQIYARHQPAILSFCRHLTGQREDAEDAVQHTFLSAYCQIAESDGALELRPWLFTVARNRCLSLLRARSARGTVALDDADQATEGLAIEVEQRQELRELVGDLSRLPEQQRAALLLAQLDDMSHREIGVVLDIAPAKVKALVFQARTSLASTREAREASCSDIRSQLATSHGSALRRRKLRRHVHECDGCRTFESIVLSQRRDLALLLPVAPSIGLREAILDLIPGRDVGAVASAGGAAATSVASGGVVGGGVMGSLATIGAQGTAKLMVAGVVAVGGTGAVVADPPVRIQHGASPTDLASAHRAPEDDDGGVPDAERRRATEHLRPAAFEPSPTASVPPGGPAAGLGPNDPVDSGDHGGAPDRKPDEPISEGASVSPVQAEPGLAPTPANGSSPPGLATKEVSPPANAKEDPQAGHTPPSSGEPSTNVPSPAKTPDRPQPSGQSEPDGDQSAGKGNGGGDGGGKGNGGGNGNYVPHAQGSNAKAKGANANAKGQDSNAKGDDAKAKGQDSDAKGGDAKAKGQNSNAAKNENATAKGDNANANGGKAGGSPNGNGAPADRGGKANRAPSGGNANPTGDTHGKATTGGGKPGSENGGKVAEGGNSDSGANSGSANSGSANSGSANSGGGGDSGNGGGKNSGGGNSGGGNSGGGGSGGGGGKH